MDIEKLTHHQNYGVTVTVAIVLSATLVAIAAMVGRGALNLKGEVIAGVATTERTAIALFLTEEPDAIVRGVKALPARVDITGEQWIVTTANGSFYMRTNPVSGTVEELRRMHGDAF